MPEEAQLVLGRGPFHVGRVVVQAADGLRQRRDGRRGRRVARRTPPPARRAAAAVRIELQERLGRLERADAASTRERLRWARGLCGNKPVCRVHPITLHQVISRR